MAVFRRCHLAAARLRPGTAASALTVAPSTAAMGFADPWHLPAARAGLASSVPPSTLTSTGNDRHEDDDHHTRPVAAVAAPRFRRRRRAATCPAAAPCRAGRRRLRGRRPSRPPGRAALVRAGPRAPGRNRASYLASSLLPQSGTGHRLPEIPEPLSGIPPVQAQRRAARRLLSSSRWGGRPVGYLELLPRFLTGTATSARRTTGVI